MLFPIVLSRKGWIALFEAFFEMSQTPFARNIPPEYLYPSIMLEEAVGRLEYAASRQLFAVLTGSSGSGKTTTIRKFTGLLDPNKYQVMYLADSKLTPRNFYKGLLEQLGCEAKFYRGDSKRQLHREIELMKGIHHMEAVVVIDEAHLLDKEMLEEVRFLLNFKMDAQSPMSLILVGQTELWDRLQLQSYAAIRQRIDIQYKFSQMDLSQVKAYITCHLDYSGQRRELFTDAAIEEISKYSGGVARIINKLCTQCLIYGSQQNKRLIDDHMVKLVIQSELT